MSERMKNLADHTAPDKENKEKDKTHLIEDTTVAMMEISTNTVDIINAPNKDKHMENNIQSEIIEKDKRGPQAIC